MPSINSARYTQRIIQTVFTEKSRMSIVSEKVHHLDPPALHATCHDLCCNLTNRLMTLTLDTCLMQNPDPPSLTISVIICRVPVMLKMTGPNYFRHFPSNLP